MSHEWDRGVQSTSSWHALEEVYEMPTAVDMILAGERSGAWPVGVEFQPLFTPGGLKASARAVVGSYAQHDPRVLGCVGDRYRATTPDEWRDVVTAAVAAGAKPTGAFSLRDGSRVLATFELEGSNGIKNQLLLVDTFDGSMKFTLGTTSVRVVCANTLALAMGQDGGGMGQALHTASLEAKVNMLKEAMIEAIASGGKVKALFEAAENTVLSARAAKAVFNTLFPEAPEGASKAAKTKLDNARSAARIAGAMGINRVGSRPGNLATLWNAATYLVDRKEDGTARPTRGESDAIDSLLFGSRADRIQEIQKTIEIVMADGSIEKMQVTEALEHGVAADQLAKKIVSDFMNGESN